MPLVRAWGASIPRDFFAVGVGKGTEQAVGRVLLAGEALSSEEEAAAFILDIDKCYENVSHVRLQKAASQHNFPLAILRMCTSMYRVQRMVVWDGVFGACVQIGQTLVVGCSFALWLL